MWVSVTPPTAFREIELGRAAIVVTPQARRSSVSALESVTRLFLMVEGEVVTEDFPAVRDMTGSAVRRKRRVGDHRTPLLVPALARNDDVAIRERQQGRRDQNPGRVRAADVLYPLSRI